MTNGAGPIALTGSHAADKAIWRNFSQYARILCIGLAAACRQRARP